MKRSIKKEKEFFDKLHKLCDEYNVVTISPTIVKFYDRWDGKSVYSISIDTEFPMSSSSGNVLELVYEKCNKYDPTQNEPFFTNTKSNKVLSIEKSKGKKLLFPYDFIKKTASTRPYIYRSE